MLIVRGTKKLRDRVKAPLADGSHASTTVLGDWFATALFWKPQAALLVNERTFVPVFMPLAPAATLLDRAPDAIAAVLRRHGVDEKFIADELEAMRDVRLAPTNNRSVLGVMNGFEFHGEIRFATRSMDLEDLSMELAQTPIDPLRGRTGSPDRELAAFLGDDRSNVIPFPTSARATARTDGRAGTGAHTGGGRRGRSVYQLKVTLLHTKPPVWRRVLVDGSATLDQVHEVIQAAFGWWNYHLHEFEVGRARYGVPDPDEDFGPPARDERRTRLDKVAKVGSSFRYTYDFGDYWEHQIKVEKVLEAVGRHARAGVHRRSPRLSTRGLRRPVGLHRSAGDPRRPDAPRSCRAGRVDRRHARWSVPTGRFRPVRVRRQPAQPASRCVRRLTRSRPEIGNQRIVIPATV